MSKNKYNITYDANMPTLVKGHGLAGHLPKTQR